MSKNNDIQQDKTMTIMTPDQVRAAISVGLWNLFIIVSADVRMQYPKMNSVAQKNVWIALEKLTDVVKNHEQYLSRASTESAWNLRRQKAYEEVAFRNPDVYNKAYYIKSPVDLFYPSINALPVAEKLKRMVYNFCWAAMNWEYAITAPDAESEKGQDKIKHCTTQVIQQMEQITAITHKRMNEFNIVNMLMAKIKLLRRK